MANEEVNPAEAAAEEILKRAADDIRAESCPQGKDCAVHFRVNEEFVKDEYEYARLITYMGEYVVITDDNPEAVSVVALIQAALNGKPLTPDRWDDFAALFGPQGACYGSWCTSFRVSAKERQAMNANAKRMFMRDCVAEGFRA